MIYRLVFKGGTQEVPTDIVTSKLIAKFGKIGGNFQERLAQLQTLYPHLDVTDWSMEEEE